MTEPSEKGFKMPILLVDLFAGPGGLGEGFSSQKEFRIFVSVEKDRCAHKTLSLRAFFRYYKQAGLQVPDEYYQYLSGFIDRDELESAYPKEWAIAYREAICAELGNQAPNHQPLIDSRIRDTVRNIRDWLLIGGPPCQAYSLVGRSRMQNADDYVRKQGHSFAEDRRHKLYQEYLRIIAMFAPAVFVMENVKGILSAKLDGDRIFPKILSDLKEPFVTAKQYGWKNTKEERYHIISFVTGKEPEPGNEMEYLIRTENYGIPQARHRVILLGIREDVFKKINERVKRLTDSDPVYIDDVIGNLPHLRSGFSEGLDSDERWMRHFHKMASAEWIKALDKGVRDHVHKSLKDLAHSRLHRAYNANGLFVPSVLGDWYADRNLKGIPNHGTRSHMDDDLARYLFVSAYGKVRHRSPHLKDFPLALLPAHKNVDTEAPCQKFSDRFKVQLKGQAASTITSHISKDGHYFIHPDPTQCRSLTVREAARIQTFPDNYFFEGGRTQQYHQVGNAVPPYLAKQLAEVVFDIFKRCTP